VGSVVGTVDAGAEDDLSDTQNLIITHDTNTFFDFTSDNGTAKPVRTLSFFLSDAFDIEGERLKVEYKNGADTEFETTFDQSVLGEVGNASENWLALAVPADSRIQSLRFTQTKGRKDGFGFDSLQASSMSIPEPSVVIAGVSLGLLGLVIARRFVRRGKE
jgi:hypothetical protein